MMPCPEWRPARNALLKRDPLQEVDSSKLIFFFHKHSQCSENRQKIREISTFHKKKKICKAFTNMT